MLKKDELTRGCMAKAHPDEMTFVLLGRDPAAASTIAFWIQERLRLGLDKPTDPKLIEAMKTMDTMRAQALQYAADRQRAAVMGNRTK